MDLVVGLQRHGLHTEVVTPRHGSGWSNRFTYREVTVHRPLRLFRSGWAARADRTVSRYIRDLTNWLVETGASADVILSDRAREEAIAVVNAARKLGIPSMIRLGGHGPGSDMKFFGESRMGTRCRNNALASDAVVVSDASSHRELLTHGAVASQVHRVTPYLRPLEATATQRSRLRRSLARINGDLFVPEGSRVVLSVERMHRESGLIPLVESALKLSEENANLHFWLVGDGPRRDWIYSRLRGDGLRQATAMPGSFGALDDIMVASDLMVHSGEEGFESQVPCAIMAALPLVVADTAAARDFFGVSATEVKERMRSDRPSEHPTEVDMVHWYEPGDPRALRNAVKRVLGDLGEARLRAQSLRRTMQRRYPREATLESYARLFRSLVDAHPARPTRVAKASE